MNLSSIHILDFAKISKGNKFSINVKKGDANRDIIIRLLENNKIFNLGKYTITFSAKFENGKEILNNLEVLNAEEGLCKLTLTQQMTNKSVQLPCEITLFDGNGVVATSSTFNLNILDSVKDYKTIVDSNEFKALTDALSTVKSVDNKFTEVDFKKANKNEVIFKGYGTLNDFDEETRKAILENNNIDINYILGEDNVKIENTDYMDVVHFNLVDNSKLLEVGYISNEGTVTSYPGAKVTDFIKVEPNEVYSSNHNWNSGFYDSDKHFISLISFSESGRTHFTTPHNARYVRLAFADSTVPEATLVRGAELPPSYVGYWEDVNVVPTNEHYAKMLKDIALSTFPKSKLEGKTWNALGDSITFGYLTKETYHKKIAEKNNMLVRNYGISGSTIAINKREDSQPMCIRFADMDPDADLITVFGGVNDVGWRIPLGTMEDRTGDTFYGACHVLFSGLIDKYWDKKIATINQLPSEDKNFYDIKLGYVKAFEEVSNYYSIPHLNLFYESGYFSNNEHFKAKYQPDGIHPNEAGYELIVDKIQTFLEQL